ncbi:MAG: DMT family transporter [Acidobacteriota bacterium]
MRVSHPPPAILILVFAVVAVSWAAILIRLASAPPLAIAFWRLALACLMILPLVIRRPLHRPPAASAGRVIMAGVLLALHFGFWIWSLALTTISSSVLLTSTQAVFSGVLGHRLLRERTTRRTWLAIALTLAGVGFIGAGDVHVSGRVLLGDLMALAAAGAAAVYLILGRRGRKSGPLLIYLFNVNGVAAMVLLLSCLAAGIPLSGFPSGTWLVFLALALGPHLAGHGLLNLAVRQVPATSVQLALMGEPVLATIYAAFLLGERPGGWFYAGAALVLGGILMEFLPVGDAVQEGRA